MVLNHIYTEGRKNNECRSGRIHENSPYVQRNFYSRIIEGFPPRPKLLIYLSMISIEEHICHALIFFS